MWIYQGSPLKESEIPEGSYGFLYKIIADGKVYFGKKALSHKKKTKLSKRARKGTRKRISISQIDSGWVNYFGSCKPLLEWIREHTEMPVYREILSFYRTRQDLSYRETELLIKENVLFRYDCWNGNIASKYFKGKINP